MNDGPSIVARTTRGAGVAEARNAQPAIASEAAVASPPLRVHNRRMAGPPLAESEPFPIRDDTV